jgi:predicted Zn finger-like uncharacterized protein
MIVRCPSCKTTYRVVDKVLKETRPLFRCSRCKHTFDLNSGEAPEDSVAALSSKTKEGQELSFTFAPKSTEDRKWVDSVTHDQRSSATDGETELPWTMISDEPAFKKLYASSETHDNVGDNKVSPAQPLPVAREATDNILSLDPYRARSASTVPYLTLFGFLLILFAFVTALHHVRPDASERIMKTIPWLGPAVLKDNHLKNGVALQSLRAGRQAIQGNREVFVVTGLAQNQNRVVIRDVRVAGQLYNLAGKQIEQQTIWIGNAISPRIIRGMTAQDISDLQRLKPLKTFEIPPGDTIPFTIVFLKSTKEIKDFSCAVLAAEGEA